MEFKLTADILREVLEYEPKTGIFIWKIRPSKAVKQGEIAGNINKFGYSTIGIKGKIYKSHRLAWLYMTGKWPEQMIDHINCNKSDNSFCNLRETNAAGNSQNVNKPNKRNKSGFQGVIFFQKKWRANITINNKTKWLGDYSTPEEAHSVYIAAKRKHHSTCSI